MNTISDPAPFVPVLKTSCIMHRCILKDDLDSLKHMLSDSRRDCLNDLDHSGRTPFHVALQCANPKALYLLLYYPLIHPSKIFATLDWTDNLDDVFSSSSSDDVPSPSSKTTLNAGDSDRRMDDSSTFDSKSDLSTDHTSDGRQNGMQNNLQTSKSSGKPFKLGNVLLEHWEESPKAYIRSALSLEDGNYIHGCGLKEVEDLYEEHFKFLVGEPHTLERAAREYTAKYPRLYSNHPANLEKIKEMLSKSNTLPLNPSNFGEHLSGPRNHTPDITSGDSKDTVTTQHQSCENNNTCSGSDIPYPNEEQKLDAGKSNHSEDNLSNESTDATSNDEHIKQLMPPVTVDLIATFDRTAPLHLLFSNVCISSYRKNVQKCFRILVGYFKKIANFDQIFNSCDYYICANGQHSENLSPNSRNRTDLDTDSKYTQKLNKFSLQLPSDDIITEDNLSRSDPKSIENIDSGQSNTDLNLQSSFKRSLPQPTEDLVAKDRKVSYTASGIPWPNNTLCAEAPVISQEKNILSLSRCTDCEFLGDLKKAGNKSTFDPRMIVLHNAIFDSSLWLKTHVSWETFIQKRDFTRSTILHKVCSTHDVKLIKLMLFYGFSPLVVNEAGDLPVHIAVEKNEPFCLLTVLHSTLKSLFYSNFNLSDNLFDCCCSDATFCGGSNRSSGNHFFNTFMKSLCNYSDQTHHHALGENGFLSEFNKDFNFWANVNKSTYCTILKSLDIESKRILFDEMLLLFEQLTYRAIRFSSWESLAAMFSYNTAITYHILSNPSLMHRFINMAASVNNQKEFMNTVDFVIKVVFGFRMPRVPHFTHPISNDNRNIGISHKKTLSKLNIQGINNTYKGCGIPHSRPRTLAYLDSLRTGPSLHENKLPNTLTDILHGFKSSGTTKDNAEPKKTWIITHPTCLHHLATPEPTDAPNKRHRLIITYPENPTRLEAIISNENGILRSDTLKNVKLVHSPPPAALADILRVHDWAYVDKLLEQVQVAQKRWVTHPYWPVLADGDTPVTPHSWSAALYAAGSVISAVDAVCTNACKNAFCAVRPPGHHLGTWGGAQSSNFEDEDFAAGSQGFCLINNVAIGAAYAKYTYAEKGIRRIAIVDFDVHHGNGTEQIIRNIGPKVVKRPIPYQGHDFDQSFEPQYSIHKHWFGWRDQKDREEVFFASIHAYDGVFYPGTGKQCIKYDDPSSPRIINVAVPQGTTSSEFRLLFEKNICPYLYHFKPDLIFISAGFDGHYRDSVSYGFTRYTEKDFYYITERLVTIANSVCEGRIISVLEGGYNTKLGTLSPFARSVFEHVSALCHTNSKAVYPYMHGQNSVDLLLSPVLHQEMVKDDDVPKPLTPEPEIDRSVLKRVYKLRMKTEMLISKVYSLKDLKCCNFDRLYKFDSTKMCSKAALERHGNAFLSFYSKYFYSLYNVALSFFFSSYPSFPDFSNLEDLNKIVEGDDFLPLLDTTLSDMFIGDSHTSSNDQNIDDILINIKAHKDNNEMNNLLLSNKWFRDIKTKSLEQNYIVSELLYNYFKKYASVFTKPCILHS
ncbi:histone deacetylase, putative [Theileria equi strain WA]|uniref:Histone deacetylase, putative n=1 Tax=Theileria equi strain WA TaxID=1537102 RepID=L1LBN1_THEEQ|nr:histone deacetylase, putative [Theileria equi strain WA]EKX72679.1 histone deacetylase, putative [Theileria equi strain WA]|eukprot:XP_004832131.1 histone deacetylase, putative [Theileria equi strain WA]